MKDYSNRYSGILLAGGLSSRMGEDKAFMRYGNRFLYEYSLSVLKVFSNDILISASDDRFVGTNYRIIADEIQGIGPLGGIYSCLKHIHHKSAIVLPCDLPLITENIIEVLLNNSGNFDTCIAINDNNLPEPLIGTYSSSLIPVIEKMIAAGQYKMQELFKVVKTNYVKFPGASPAIFRNINFPTEYKSLPPIEFPPQ